ncbi:MAG TPA: hypothetical protein PK640_03065 [Verrucomicrobiota bacterium]|nr:hypothetical protein [Verrucomicrobiota bacterium]
MKWKVRVATLSPQVRVTVAFGARRRLARAGLLAFSLTVLNTLDVGELVAKGVAEINLRRVGACQWRV